MFLLFVHHDFEVLAKNLQVAIQRRENPLIPETVLVPNPGIGRWLKMWIAEHSGIAANINVRLPGAFLWEIIHQSIPGVPEESPFEPARMRWHIFDLLEGLAKDEPLLRGYFEDSHGALGAQAPFMELKRFQLADRLACVFDDYIQYRPRLLESWQKGGDEGFAWQAELWRRFVDRVEMTPGWGVQVGLSIESLLRSLGGQRARPSLPDRVFWFGFANVSPAYLRAFFMLSAHTDLKAYLADPNAPFLEEGGLYDGFGEEAFLSSPLLASMGRAGRDFLRLVAREFSIDNNARVEVLPLKPKKGGTKLKALQAGLVQKSPPGRGWGFANNQEDISIQVHACASPLREVQVLYDHILDLLGRVENLGPRDIVVMTPDVSQYAQAIEGVFGNPLSKIRLPFSICDKPKAASHPLLQAFRALLDISSSRFSVGETMALLSVPATMRAFELTDQDLAKIKVWVQASGIRWGLDGSTRERFQAGSYEQSTWRFGMNRLLLGLAQPYEDALFRASLGGTEHTIAPFADLEGQGAQPLGKLASFLETLQDWHTRLKGEKTLQQWHADIVWMVEKVFCLDPADDAEGYAKRLVDEAIFALTKETQGLPRGVLLHWGTIREVLIEDLAQGTAHPPFPSGGITFCGMVRLRALPFKVVCLLGMNDDAFPRKENAGKSLSLIPKERMLGDKNLAEDDRLLFLQCLLAARDAFYVSYIGKDLQAGQDLEPSLLVLELLEYLKTPLGLKDAKDFITYQPLQPFSRRYFEEGAKAGVFSFDEGWGKAAEAKKKPTVSLLCGRIPVTSLPDRIELDLLKRFFKNPTKHFFEKSLNVRLERTEIELLDDEPLTLDGFAAWRLRENLLKKALQEGGMRDPGSLMELYTAKGMLPPPPLGEADFQRNFEAVKSLLECRQRWLKDAEPLEPLNVSISFSGVPALVGRIEDVWSDGIRRLRPGSLNAQHVLPAWIDYLAFLASGKAGRLLLAGLEEDKISLKAWEVEKENAEAFLKNLLVLHLEGLERPLPFMPNLAEDFLRKKAEEGVANAKNWLMEENLGPASDKKHRHQDTKDPHFRMHAFPDADGFPSEDFMDFATRVLEPLSTHEDSQGGRRDG